jgi:hypothetical protein
VLSLGLDAAAATANGTTTTTSPVLVVLSATADRLLHEENIYVRAPKMNFLNIKNVKKILKKLLNQKILIF